MICDREATSGAIWGIPANSGSTNAPAGVRGVAVKRTPWSSRI
jgi:hypothetical protein